jgi:hypothetical protein
MGLLDGGIQAVGGKLFGSFFLNGTLWKASRDADGRIIKPIVWTGSQVKVQVDDFGFINRAAAGVPDKAVAILILQAGMAAMPSMDDELTVLQGPYGGRRFRLGIMNGDPAGIGWETTGVPAQVA